MRKTRDGGRNGIVAVPYGCGGLGLCEGIKIANGGSFAEQETRGEKRETINEGRNGEICVSVWHGK